VRQAAVADHLVVTKTDIAEQAVADALIARLTAINPAATVIRAAHASGAMLGALARESFEAGASGEARLPALDAATTDAYHHYHHGHDQDAGIQAFAITAVKPLDWTAFGIWLTLLLNRHGERVLRVKAILSLIGEENPVAVHGVQHIVHSPIHMRGWPDGDRRSRLVFIVDGLDPALVRRSFAAFTRDDNAC
jgi:G3E family GTPase